MAIADEPQDGAEEKASDTDAPAEVAGTADAEGAQVTEQQATEAQATEAQAIAEPDVEDSTGPEPTSDAEPESEPAAPETHAEPKTVARVQTPELETVTSGAAQASEPVPDKPAAPKRRGWWSRG